MTPIAIIQLAQADGVSLTQFSAGTIKLIGNSSAVNRWLSRIRENKQAIIETLQSGAIKSISRRWLIHYADREPRHIVFCSDMDYSEIMERFPGAIAAEPFFPIYQPPPSPMNDEEKAAILAWLKQINEFDMAAIAEVIEQCQRDANARNYFISRAMAELSISGEKNG